MGTRTFELGYLVGTLTNLYTSRVHADGHLEASRKIRALVPAWKEIVTIHEIAQPVPSGGLSSVDVGDAADRSVIWTGNSDVEASAGRGHAGQVAQVTVGVDGDVRVDMIANITEYTCSQDTFAPLNYAEEALALRACVRSLAARLVCEAEIVDGFRASAAAHAALAATAPTTSDAVRLARHVRAALAIPADLGPVVDRVLAAPSWRDVELGIFGGRRVAGQAREVEYLGLPALEVREDSTADREPVVYMRTAVFSMRVLTAAESAERAVHKVSVERARQIERLICGAVLEKPLTKSEIRGVVDVGVADVADGEFNDAFMRADIVAVDGNRWEPGPTF